MLHLFTFMYDIIRHNKPNGKVVDWDGNFTFHYLDSKILLVLSSIWDKDGSFALAFDDFVRSPEVLVLALLGTVELPETTRDEFVGANLTFAVGLFFGVHNK